MPFDPQNHHRRSIRLPAYDYALPGSYFVTICVQDRRPVLASIYGSSIQLQPAGLIVDGAWHDLPNRFPWVELDAFVEMPNHLHGIIRITTIGAAVMGEAHSSPLRTGVAELGVMNHAPTRRQSDELGRPLVTLGEIIRTFKAVATRSIRSAIDPTFAWQRSFYEHIIRNDRSLDRIREYIANNAARWQEDRYFVHDGARA